MRTSKALLRAGEAAGTAISLPLLAARREVLLGLAPVLAVATFAVMPVATQAASPAMNGKIAFYSNRDGNDEIYAMNPDGSGQTRLTDNAAVDINPAWSRNGSKIAFVSYRDGNAEIYVMNPDGSGQTNLTNNPAYDDCPAWSPDGSKIAFVSDRGGNTQVYVMNTDGSGVSNVTNTTAGVDCPAWSPDGSKLAFGMDVGVCCGRLDIYVMSANGGGLTPVITGPLTDNKPDWSPDGTMIAFESDREQLFSDDVYVSSASGTGQTRLTEGGQSGVPAWSPDGSKIAFATSRDGNGEIYVMKPDGSGQTNLTDNPAQDWFPAWQPLHVKASTTLKATPLLRLPGRVRATLTSIGAPLVGATIKFTVGVTTLCSATTATNGSATCSPSLFGLIRAVLAHGYTATFAGDANHDPSTDHAGLF